MAATAGDSATVFLETTLDTRLVVSFPAGATTVADLKRQVIAEHAAGFPRAGPIAVTSLQVELDGSWFLLTDSVNVRGALEWFKGPWRLRAEAHELGSHPLACKDAKRGMGDAEPNPGQPVISKKSSQCMLPPAVSQGEDDGISDTGTPQMNQQNGPQEGVDNASVQCRDGVTLPQESSVIELAAGDSDTPLPNQDIPQDCVEHGSDQLKDGVTMLQESSEFDLAAGITDAPAMNQQDQSHESAEHEHASSQSKDRITLLEESSDLGMAAEKGNSHVGGQQKDITAEPRGKKRFREGDKTNERIVANCVDRLSTPTFTPNTKLSEKKSCVTDQPKLNSVPLMYNLDGHEHGLEEKPSGGLEPWGEARELHSHPLPGKCGTCDAETNAGHPFISKKSSQCMLPPAVSQGGGSLASGDGICDTNTPQMNQQNKPQKGVQNASVQCRDGISMPQESSDIKLAAGDNENPLQNQDKPRECVEHGSDQLEDGITMPQESSDIDVAAGDSDNTLPNQESVEHGFDPQESSEFDLAAGISDAPPMNQQNKSHESAEHASGQSEDRITMLEESSDLGIAADKGNSPVGGQEKDIIAEPRGKKHFREGDKTNERIVANCGDDLSSLASFTLNAELSEKKSCVTEQAKLNSAPLLHSFEGSAHGLVEKPSVGQDPWTSGLHNGESSNASVLPPCVESMERKKSSDKEVKIQRGDEDGPCIAGHPGKSIHKRTDAPHCVEITKEDVKRPAFDNHYIDRGQNEGSTSTVNRKHAPCIRRIHKRIVVRKVPISRAMNMYSFRY